MVSPRSRILVVEDDELVRRTISAMLERMECEILHASDGVEAMSVVESLDPDLVLLDLMMPRMNGFQFLRAFRALDRWETPVVIVSAKNDPVDHYWARKLGAVDYIPKPFRYRRLAEIVETALAETPKAGIARNPQPSR